ncbi:hypothetical protein BCR32DRAFT_274268 [Anaeromyces robustus]|uniref:sphingomyelin phosphodiesterase n=1 Tax=Anaeromyces robustus TaxID=1754192 RepID=A0A1Y1XPI9_9FUNG|nr:hypothetical protein BCR32DRAFT_274268 [Anaeromyces robustus]|eukprot:ORX87660.1 hypothetical protein BCR32DRAFT_274268 [Anaeromyces robustus]
MENIRILSYNVFLRPPPVHDKLSDYKEERVKLIGDTVVPNYDIIAFEEAFGSLNKRRDALKEYGKKHGLIYNYSDAPHSICNLKVDGGLLLLSRYPIVEKDSTEYSRGCHSDWLASKGALYVRLKIGDNKHINIFLTHLQASYEEYPKPDSKAVKVRMQQALHLHKFIFEHMKNHKNEPCFVMGDFNVDGVRPPEEIENKGWYSDKSTLKDKNLDVYAHSNEYIALVNILKGDLNSVPEEYKPQVISEASLLGANKIEPRFNIRDLIYNFQDPNLHPITTSNFRGTDQPYEQKSLDYIFELTPYEEVCYNYENREDDCKTPINNDMQPDQTKIENNLLSNQYKVCSAKVEPYEVNNPNYKYLSDHLSVTTTVQI